MGCFSDIKLKKKKLVSNFRVYLEDVRQRKVPEILEMYLDFTLFTVENIYMHILKLFQICFSTIEAHIHFFLCFFFFSFLSFFFSFATHVVHGSSQARGQSYSCDLQHSHSNTGSEPHLQPTLQLVTTRDP